MNSFLIRKQKTILEPVPILALISSRSLDFRESKCLFRAAFLNRRAAARYRALASIIPGRENLSF
jgi:hypothetical protein